MPQVIPIVAYYGALYFGATAIVATVIATVVAAAVNDHQRKKASRQARDAYNASLQDRLIMTATTNGARSRIYGEARNVDGVLFKGTHGTNNQFYTLVVALAGHECESIEKVYFGDQELTLSSDGAGGFWVQTEPFLRSAVVSGSEVMTTVGTVASVTLPHTPISGSVVINGAISGSDGGSFVYEPSSVVGSVVTVDPVHPDDPGNTALVCNYQYLVGVPKARIWKYLGTDSQDVGTDLLASRFPALINVGTDPNTGLPNEDRFAGICLVVVELQYDQDAFVLGVPNVTGLVRGAKILDTRTDTTAWTQNPSVIARDWSLYASGGACLSAEVPEAMVEAAANACDTSTDFETPTGTETRPLYQCNIVCRLDVPPDQHLDEIIESMAGKKGWAGGTLRWVAGVYRAPVEEITEEWVTDVESIVVVKEGPRAEAVNVYRPTIANADMAVDGTTGQTAAYTMLPLPEVRSATYITEDGEELPREITLGGVTHNVQAQHICGVYMRDARAGLTIKLPVFLRGLRLELFDTVTLPLPVFGFVEKEFEIVGWSFGLESAVILEMKETEAAIFDPDAEFEDVNASPNSSMVLPWVVPEVEGLAVTSGITELEDGTPQTRVLVSWDASESESVLQSGKIEVQYAELGAAGLVWFNAPPVDGSSTSVTITGLRQYSYCLFRARQVNTLRVRSAWCVHELHLVAAPPDDAAAAAQAAADAALDALDDIASDGMLTPVEKHRVMVEVNVLLAEQTGIDATATAQGITTELTAYDDAVDDLTNYLDTLTTPTDWDDVSGNTTVVRATFNGWFEAVYAARQELLNLIAVTIATGAVGTEQIAPGAATELFTQDAATLTQHGDDNLINYTATSDCTVVLKVECIATADQDAGPTGAVYTARMAFGAVILLAGTSTVVSNASKQTRPATIGNSPAEVKLTSIVQVDMEEGDDWDFGMRLVGDYFPDLNWTFTEGNTQIEIIKR